MSAKVICISGPSGATDMILDYSFVRSYGVRICCGCDSAITADIEISPESRYCGPCEDRAAQLDAIYRRTHAQFSQQPQIETGIDMNYSPDRRSAWAAFADFACFSLGACSVCLLVALAYVYLHK